MKMKRERKLEKSNSNRYDALAMATMTVQRWQCLVWSNIGYALATSHEHSGENSRICGVPFVTGCPRRTTIFGESICQGREDDHW